jgi:hypothetical protein
VARVAAIIFHPPAAPGAGPLAAILSEVRRRNAERHRAGFAGLGADAEIVDELGSAGSFGAALRERVAVSAWDGVVVLGSGSLPLARQRDRASFVAAAAGPAGTALANNRYSADAIAVAGTAPLERLPDLASDNGLPRLLERAGVTVGDLRDRWRLQVDLDSPLDAILTDARGTLDTLARRDLDVPALRAGLAGVQATARDASRELLVAGRASARGLAWLETRTASRTRALVEERGFRTRPPEQRPVRSSLGLLLDRDGPESLGPRLTELADAALVDSRVLLAHRFGADERSWPSAEDRFASDLLLPDRITDSWLRALTVSVREAPIPVLLGGHTLVGPGLRLVLGSRPWT